MKRLFSMLIAGVLLSLAVSAFADDSGIYVKTVSITKIYTNQLGYKIVYPTGNLQTAEIYIPAEWFTAAASKGEIVWGEHPSYPYMSIFWEDGKFDHIRLYLQKNLNSPSWGVLEASPDLKDVFNIDTLTIEF